MARANDATREGLKSTGAVQIDSVAAGGPRGIKETGVKSRLTPSSKPHRRSNNNKIRI